jgi:DNA-binding transcriptional MerR regulator
VKTLRPADLAGEHGISTQAVRNYERDGLIPPAQRTASGYRVYTGVHAAALRAYLALIPAYGHGASGQIMNALHHDDLGTALMIIDHGHRQRLRDGDTLDAVRTAVNHLTAQLGHIAPPGEQRQNATPTPLGRTVPYGPHHQNATPTPLGQTPPASAQHKNAAPTPLGRTVPYGPHHQNATPTPLGQTPPASAQHKNAAPTPLGRTVPYGPHHQNATPTPLGRTGPHGPHRQNAAPTPSAGANTRTIGELAHQLGGTPATLRSWEQAGILAPARDPATGYRIFDAGDIRDAELAHLLRRGDYLLDHIASVVQQIRTAGGTGTLSRALEDWQHKLTAQGVAMLTAAARLSDYLQLAQPPVNPATG